MEQLITINGIEKTEAQWLEEYRRLGGLQFKNTYSIAGKQNLLMEIERQKA